MRQFPLRSDAKKFKRYRPFNRMYHLTTTALEWTQTDTWTITLSKKKFLRSKNKKASQTVLRQSFCSSHLPQKSRKVVYNRNLWRRNKRHLPLIMRIVWMRWKLQKSTLRSPQSLSLKWLSIFKSRASTWPRLKSRVPITGLPALASRRRTHLSRQCRSPNRTGADRLPRVKRPRRPSNRRVHSSAPPNSIARSLTRSSIKRYRLSTLQVVVKLARRVKSP